MKTCRVDKNQQILLTFTVINKVCYRPRCVCSFQVQKRKYIQVHMSMKSELLEAALRRWIDYCSYVSGARDYKRNSIKRMETAERGQLSSLRFIKRIGRCLHQR